VTTYLFKSVLDPGHRRLLFDRLDRLDPACVPRWGRLTAPAMVAHLRDQMQMPFNEHPSAPIPGVPRKTMMRAVVLYLLPWPEGVIPGPPEAFRSVPGAWREDIEALKAQVEFFVAAPPRPRWPDQPNFGRMSRRDWGVFCYRHFDHHLRQFGA
jgi:hypothetical protein